MLPGKWKLPRTVDLPTSGASAGAVLMVSGVADISIARVGVTVRQPAKWTRASTAADAVANFASGAYGVLASGAYALEVGGTMADGQGTKLAFTAHGGGAATGGISYWLIQKA